MKPRRKRPSAPPIVAAVRRVEKLRALLDRIEVERDPVKLLRLVERFSRLFDRGLA